MGVESNQKAHPKVVKLNKALKLAEAWVNNMSVSTSAEPTELLFEGRPSRLGLGAEVIPNARPIASTDPIEKKLLGKLKASQRQMLKTREGTNASQDDIGSEDDDDAEPESRAKAFAKKRALPPPVYLRAHIKRCK